MSVTMLLALMMAAGPASAEQSSSAAKTAPTADVDSRWAQWLGCWRLEDDLPGTGLRVCITPEQTTGVKWQTLVGAQRGTVDIIVANGVARAISDTDCKGTERAEWSRNGQRVFRLSDVTCGTEGPRKISSVAFLTRGPVLVNVQYVEGGPSTSVRVQRYRRAIDQTLADGSLAPQASPRAASSAPGLGGTWSVDDVIEASGKLPADAVQAALTGVSGPFNLNKKNLVAMSDAGVSEGVIDLMVALTYPKKFVVQRAGGGDAMPLGISMGGGWYDPFFSPIVPASSFFADCYSPFGYGYWSYYNACRPYYSTYGYWGDYGYGYQGYSYGTGGWVIVDSGPTTPAQPALEGRVVNGRGYTQVRPREPETPGIRTGGGGANGSNGANSGGSNNGSSSGTSGVSSGGYSGGSSSGGDSGRVAVPRPPDS